MKYVIAIEPGTATTAWGVVVPDLPGCFSAGDTLDEAVDNARDAIETWMVAVVEDGGAIPPASPMEQLASDPDYAGWMWGVVELDPARLDCTIERVNVSLPRRVIARLDALAAAAGTSRSGLIASLAMSAHT